MLPGPTSTKNAMLSPAAADLGYGDQLKAQVEDTVEERKKSILNIPGMDTPMQMNTSVSPAVQSLLMKAGGGA